MYKRVGNDKQHGFTIVELLIVIVIIAILAAITIVAYNGIQQRANNTATIESTAQFIKAYHLHAVDKGEYPPYTGCLGEGYPGGRCLSQNNTNACFGMGTGGINASIPTALRPYMGGKVTSPSMQQIPCGGTTYVGTYASYSSVSGRITIFTVLNGDVTCPPMSPNVMSVVKSTADSATLCRYNLGDA